MLALLALLLVSSSMAALAKAVWRPSRSTCLRTTSFSLWSASLTRSTSLSPLSSFGSTGLARRRPAWCNPSSLFSLVPSSSSSRFLCLLLTYSFPIAKLFQFPFFWIDHSLFPTRPCNCVVPWRGSFRNSSFASLSCPSRPFCHSISFTKWALLLFIQIFGLIELFLSCVSDVFFAWFFRSFDSEVPQVNRFCSLTSQIKFIVLKFLTVSL